MSFKVIKAKIKEKLDNISEIQEVKDYPQQDFGGYPAANVRTLGNDSDYETTNENDELYVFAVTLFYSLDNSAFGPDKVRDIMDELCDTVRDEFDSDEFLDGISLPTGRVMIGIRPTVSDIKESDNGKYITADIEIATRVSKIVRN